MCIEPATKLAVVARSQSGHIHVNHPINHWMNISDELRRPATATVKIRRRPSPVVAARRRFNAQRKTELNSTEQFSSVLSFSFFLFLSFFLSLPGGTCPLHVPVLRPALRAGPGWTNAQPQGWEKCCVARHYQACLSDALC